MSRFLKSIIIVVLLCVMAMAKAENKFCQCQKNKDLQKTRFSPAPEVPQNAEEFRAILGRATWRLLHTMAARYPEDPDEDRKQQTRMFLDLLADLYPCEACGSHMKKFMMISPPKVDSQHEFSQWMCGIHNKANRALGKPQFPCADVDSYYDCGCELD